MEPLLTKTLDTRFGPKEISVYLSDVCDLNMEIDVLTLSAYQNNYDVTSPSVIGALYRRLGLNVSTLAKRPQLDLRSNGSVWLSEAVQCKAPIRRIGCVELMDPFAAHILSQEKESLLNNVNVYFKMLDIAASTGTPMRTVALSALGTGVQNIALDFMLAPLLNECIGFLERCQQVQRLLFYERSPAKAYQIAKYLDTSYRLMNHDQAAADAAGFEEEEPVRNTPSAAPGPADSASDKPLVFISYCTKDREAMLRLNELLEQGGLRTWFAPRDLFQSSYAQGIVRAIRQADYVVVLLSANSVQSRHVINEIDLAFNSLSSENRLLPILLDNVSLTDSFAYYLSRLEWYRVRSNTLLERLPLFEDKILMLLDLAAP